MSASNHYLQNPGWQSGTLSCNPPNRWLFTTKLANVDDVRFTDFGTLTIKKEATVAGAVEVEMVV